MKRSFLGALAFDVAAVLIFVSVGREEHQQGTAVGEILTVAAPFLIGVGAAALLALALRCSPWSLLGGVVVLVTTLVVGMVLRRVVWDRGTATAFVVVTSAFLTVCFLGWRALWASVIGRRPVRSLPTVEGDGS